MRATRLALINLVNQFFVLICFICITPNVCAQNSIDINGQKLPDELVSLIGKKLKRQAVNPKIGESGMAFSPVNGWKSLLHPSGLHDEKIFRLLPILAQPELTHRQLDSTLNSIDTLNTNKYHEPDCGNALTGWYKSQIVYLTITEFCKDRSIKVVKYLLKVPSGYGIETQGKITPTLKANPEEKEDIKNIESVYSYLLMLLPKHFYDERTCGRYLGGDASIQEAGVKVYGYDPKDKSVTRINKPSWRVYSLDHLCRP
jgi:hypothetical protein